MPGTISSARSNSSPMFFGISDLINSGSPSKPPRIKSGSNQDQIRIKLGSNQDQIRIKLGSNQGQIRISKQTSEQLIVVSIRFPSVLLPLLVGIAQIKSKTGDKNENKNCLHLEKLDLLYLPIDSDSRLMTHIYYTYSWPC